MSDESIPTPEDLARDLRADLRWMQELPCWPLIDELRRVCFAALRRAITAESALARCVSAAGGPDPADDESWMEGVR